MSRYIDAEKEMEREGMTGNCQNCKHYIGSLKECAGGAEMEAVCHFLTYTHGADVDPVKHGRWLPEGKYACRCSNCGRAINNRLAASYKFCPECGAKTDKKEE